MSKVCVIGAGAAGLCAARHLSRFKGKLIPTLFESSPYVGGTWVYTDQVGKDSHGRPIHSSMYKNMKTNLPKEVMAFPDFPFRKELNSFLHHSQVREYLEEYCDAFDLRALINFETSVEDVAPVQDAAGKSKWRVTIKKLDTNEEEQIMFDYVMVCNGHYSTPLIPDLKGLENFKGQVIHSHDYRDPEIFRLKNIAILGSGASGKDISLEVATAANQVYLCHNSSEIESKLPRNMTQVKGIEACVSDFGFILRDGSKLQADVLLLCTGYEFSFPFLDKSGVLEMKNQKISNLYKHMIHVKYPSLCFIGIPTQICPFPLFDMQVQLFCKIMANEVQSPSEEEMLHDLEAEAKERSSAGLPERHFHQMGTRQWPYNDSIADMAKIPRLNENVEKLYRNVHATRKTDLSKYKQFNYTFDSDKGYIRA